MRTKGLVGVTILGFFSGLSWGEEPDLKFKVGQMFVIGCPESEFSTDSVVSETIRTCYPGGIILYNSEYDKSSHA
ncbi:MAG: hypothetical protein LBR62_02140, partial [Puniceicoccales bacterium]|nr:hypothetical protein [Puniceicoccales bacterium]